MRGFTHLISFTGTESKVHMRVYSIHIDRDKVDEYLKVLLKINQTGNSRVFGHLELLGPNADLVLRRNQIANEDTFKEACKQPALKKKDDKNVGFDNVGDKIGIVYTQKQDLDYLPLKRRKV